MEEGVEEEAEEEGLGEKHCTLYIDLYARQQILGQSMPFSEEDWMGE